MKITTTNIVIICPSKVSMMMLLTVEEVVSEFSNLTSESQDDGRPVEFMPVVEIEAEDEASTA